LPFFLLRQKKNPAIPSIARPPRTPPTMPPIAPPDRLESLSSPEEGETVVDGVAEAEERAGELKDVVDGVAVVDVNACSFDKPMAYVDAEG
jgi:hypothetical protein